MKAYTQEGAEVSEEIIVYTPQHTHAYTKRDRQTDKQKERKRERLL